MEKEWTVYVYHWPADEHDRELWLGYTRFENYNSRSYVGAFRVVAATRQRAITKAIREAKARGAREEG